MEVGKSEVVRGANVEAENGVSIKVRKDLKVESLQDIYYE
jgi:hypothetical protein